MSSLYYKFLKIRTQNNIETVIMPISQLASQSPGRPAKVQPERQLHSEYACEYGQALTTTVFADLTTLVHATLKDALTMPSGRALSAHAQTSLQH